MCECDEKTREYVERSHMAISKSISNLMKEHSDKIEKIEGRLDSHIGTNSEAVRENNRLVLSLHEKLEQHVEDENRRFDELQPVTDFITTMTFGRKLVVGMATVIASLGAIGLFLKGLR